MSICTSERSSCCIERIGLPSAPVLGRDYLPVFRAILCLHSCVQWLPRPARPGGGLAESVREVAVDGVEVRSSVPAEKARSVAEVALSGARFCLRGALWLPRGDGMCPEGAAERRWKAAFWTVDGDIALSILTMPLSLSSSGVGAVWQVRVGAARGVSECVS